MQIEVTLPGGIHRYAASLFGLGPADDEYLKSLSLQDRSTYREKAAENFVLVMEQQLKKLHIEHYQLAIIFSSKGYDDIPTLPEDD